MAAKVKLAKLTRPRTNGLFERGRLFALLDRARSKPVIWVTAPPGAGKSSLIASYVEARESRELWYQVDHGDSDISTFFHYLGLAVQQSNRRHKAELPRFSPEFLPDPSGFARAFFRELFSRIPERAAVVLDNYQDIPEDAVFHAVIREAIEQIPVGINLIIISRSGPPSQLLRHVANGLVAQLEWAELKLTLEEATGIGKIRELPDDKLLRQLHEYSEGWMAGFTLMLEQTRRSGRVATPEHAESMQTIFDYFAGQIFDAASPEDQQVLMQTAFLPIMTAKMAERVSANPNAVKLLDRLHRRQLFVDRRLGEESSYQYHALFRAFLLARAKQIFTPFGLTQLARHAAAILDEGGYREQSVALYLDVQDWPAAKTAILNFANDLFATGRWETLRQWISTLPAEVLSTEPWLLYWLGISEVALQPRRASNTLEQAYGMFRERGDAFGQTLSCAGILYADYTDFQGGLQITQWIHRLVDLLFDDPVFPHVGMALEVYAVLIEILHLRQPHSAFLSTCVDRLMALLRNPAIHASRKSFAAGLVINYCLDTEDDARIAAAMEYIRPVLAKERLDQFHDAYAWNYYAVYCLGSGDLPAAQRFTDQVIAFGQTYACNRFTAALRFRLILASIARDRATLQSIAATFAADMPDLQWKGFLSSHNSRASIAMLEGDTSSAIRHFEAVLHATRAKGLVWFEVVALLNLATLAALRGEYESALLYLSQARKLLDGTQLIAAQREGWLIEAYVRDARGERGACRDLLTQALETRTPFLWSLLLIPNDLLPAVCAIALDQNIARGNVRQLIERFELQAPSPEAQTWPWPVKVYTLGRMYVEKDGEPLRFGHKAQRKPLDLLKALIAFGGRQIDIERLAESIWPDLDGDAAMKVFQITLYRLRKLLGRDDALELHESKLTLNDRCCWVDAWTFERLVDTIDADAEGSREKATQALATRLTQLYAGHFLEKEGDPVWAIAMRDRLRSKYLRCVVMLGIALERAAHWEQAANLYRRALERDNLAEEIYRHLMLCYQQLGLHAQALETYRRCRDMLSLLLGARPCGETEALHARIRQVA